MLLGAGDDVLHVPGGAPGPTGLPPVHPRHRGKNKGTKINTLKPSFIL